MPINKFSIIGERCSGTKFLEHVMKHSFRLEQVKGTTATIDHKHWMQPENFTQRSTEDILYIGIIRDPIQWLCSFYSNKWHIPGHMKYDCNKFLTDEWYSINDEGDYQEIMHDRHPYTKERFKNIFELRKVKAKFLQEDMRNLVKNYVFVRYEDLLDNMSVVLKQISDIIGQPIIESSESLVSRPSYHCFSEDIMRIIKDNIDRETEFKLGYLKDWAR